jgi:hypothetical protein
MWIGYEYPSGDEEWSVRCDGTPIQIATWIERILPASPDPELIGLSEAPVSIPDKSFSAYNLLDVGNPKSFSRATADSTGNETRISSRKFSGSTASVEVTVLGPNSMQIRPIVTHQLGREYSGRGGQEQRHRQILPSNDRPLPFAGNKSSDHDDSLQWAPW